MNRGNFFSELKRRNVILMAGLYRRPVAHLAASAGGVLFARTSG
jgi:hypothetical protein